MLENNAEDKRIFERKSFSSILRFRTNHSKRDEEGLTHNISAGGMSFVTKQKIKPKEALELWIGVPESRTPLYKTAEVIWAKENLVNTYETGIKFDSVGLMELSRIFKERQ